MANMDQELDEIRRMLGMDEQPSKPAAAASPKVAGAFNLDDLLTEIGGVVDQARQENAKTPLEIPVELKNIDVDHLVDDSEPEELKPKRPMQTQQINVTPKRPVQTQQADVSPQTQVLQTFDDDDEEEISYKRPKHGGRMHKERKKNSFAKRDQWQAREKQNMRAEEEDITVRDPQVAMRACIGRVRSLSVRSVAVLIIGLVLLYMSVANGLGLPIAESMDFALSTSSAVMIMLVAQILAMVISIDVLGTGFYNLITGKAERTSLVTCACMASLLHMACMLLVGWAPYLPYCSISVLLLYFSLLEERHCNAGRARAYKTAMANEAPLAVVAHADQVDGVRRTTKRTLPDNKDFLIEMERPDFTEYFSRVYVPILLVAALVFSVISCFNRKEYSSFFWTVSAVLSMATPLPLICAFGKAYSTASRRLIGEGGAIAGGRAAQSIRRAREVILTDADLFPMGTIVVKDVRAESNAHAPEKLLAYASAAADVCNLAMSTALTAALKEQYGRPIHAQDPKTYESGGLAVQILGENFLMGTAAFMSRIGISVVEEKSDPYTVFMAINGQHVGSIRFKYHASSATYHSMQSIARLGMHPVLAQHDGNISAAMVERVFEMKRGTVGEISADRVDVVRNNDYAKGEIVGALLARDNISALAQVHLSADRLTTAVRSNLILGAFAGACGSLLMFYLTFLGVYEAIVPMNVAIYLLLWFIPSIIVTMHAGNGV